MALGITDYAWNFGDDTPVITTHGRITTHVFLRSATFVVNLVVTDSAGRTSDSKSHNVIVGAGNPIPSFTVVPSTARIGLDLVTFDASATQVFGGTTIDTYLWDFDDPLSPTPTSSVGPQTTHTFSGAARTANVKLTVVDKLGRRGSTIVQVILQ